MIPSEVLPHICEGNQFELNVLEMSLGLKGLSKVSGDSHLPNHDYQNYSIMAKYGVNCFVILPKVILKVYGQIKSNLNRNIHCLYFVWLARKIFLACTIPSICHKF